MADQKTSNDPVPTKTNGKVEIVEPRPESSTKQTVGKIVKALASFPTLFILNAAYVVLGAEIFSRLEKPNEKHECFTGLENYNTMENASVTLMLDIADRVGNGLMQNSEGKGIVEEDFTEILRAFSQSVLQVGYNVSKNCSMLGETNGPSYKWSWTGSLIFATTVTTTIGYGQIAPVTKWGRLTCIAYTLLGIPLMLLCLTSIGEIFAQIFQYIYATFCCCGICKKRPRKEKPIEDPVKWIARHAYLDEDEEDSDCESDFEEEIDDYRHAAVPLTISVIMLLSFNLMGAAIFAILESWTFINAIYFCFVTFSTIGFGDMVPGITDLDSSESSAKLLLVGIYETLGIAWLSMCFQLVQDELVAKFRWIGEKLGFSKPKEELITK